MCGVAGAIGAIDDEVERAVRAMTDAQAHRGPDDAGFFSSPGPAGACFGFRRLAIMDLSPSGHQPMVDEQTGCVIVFNGEIYNFAELRAELAGSGASFRSTGDTEVILRAYARWGADMLRRLRGMFALAIYDPQRRTVLVARDRLGIKPLYHAEIRRPGGKTLLFASELRALLATGLCGRALDATGLATYLWNGFVVGPGTMVEGVSSLPAGAAATVAFDAPEVAPRPYWRLTAQPTLPAEESVATLRHELELAMRQHMVSDVPLGVFLSGGVDSSAVTALAVRSGMGRVKTFHIGFDEGEFNESAYARRVADALGTEHAEFRLTQGRFQGLIEPALASLDQPTFDAINSYVVSRVVREAGLTVALAGTGGDELFGGYRSFRDLPKAERLARYARLLPLSLMGRGVTRAQAAFLGGTERVPPQTRWGKLGDLLAAGPDLVALYQVFYGLYTTDFLAELADRAVLARAPRGLPPPFAAELGGNVQGAGALTGTSLLELSLFVGERLLRDTDAASMAVSLEVRVPLLDHRVVEAALSVEAATRYQPLGKKELLKKLGMPELDPALFERPKSGFVLPIEVWAKDQLAADIEATLGDEGATRRVGLRSEALLRLWRAFRAGAPGLYWSRVWAPYVLLKWCAQHRLTLA
jgi:asparagine synthase (glutamine-hydrolysing)